MHAQEQIDRFYLSQFDTAAFIAWADGSPFKGDISFSNDGVLVEPKQAASVARAFADRDVRLFSCNWNKIQLNARKFYEVTASVKYVRCREETRGPALASVESRMPMSRPTLLDMVAAHAMVDDLCVGRVAFTPADGAMFFEREDDEVAVSAANGWKLRSDHLFFTLWRRWLDRHEPRGTIFTLKPVFSK